MRPSPIRRCSAAIAALMVSAIVGCGGSETGVEGKEHRYEALNFRESLAEVPLGDYAVPVPVSIASEGHGLARENRVQFRFELHALVDPSDAQKTAELTERHAGQLRDGVIRVCRNTSLDELLDPELSTLRSRLLDATQPLLESVALRRVLITQRKTEPL